MSNIYIGTSGFSYPHWRGYFYPKDLPQSEWFLYYTKHFDTVEINTTFYRQIKKETFENWRKIAGDKFVFALKGNRFITHIKKLKNCQKEVEKFFETIEVLGDKEAFSDTFFAHKGAKFKNSSAKLEKAAKFAQKGRFRPSLNAVLWQLPPGMIFDKVRLKNFLAILPKTFRHAFEFRDKSWMTKETFVLLKNFNAAVVFQDYPEWPVTQKATADFIYLRFHGRANLYSSCYTKKELLAWSLKIKDWAKKGKDVYAYFNNDALGYAIGNAQTLKRLCLKKN